jgi:hypothetical protein
MHYPIYIILISLFIIGIVNTDMTVLGQTENIIEDSISNETKVISSKQGASIINQSGIDISQQKALNITSQTIEIPATEFNQFLDTVKTSIDLLYDENYDEALSKLGLAVVQILNSTQQYQELAKFASSQYTNVDDLTE